MRKDGSAYDRQVSVRAYEVVRELTDKVEQLGEACPVYLHRRMLAVEADAVLIIVNIRRILQEPVRPVDRDRNYPVVLSCRVVYSACIAFILSAQLTSRINGCRHVAGSSYSLRVLLRLGQVDRYIQVAVLCRSDPLHILADAVSSYIVGILTELIVPLSSSLRTLSVFCPELTYYLCRPRCEPAHDLCIEEVSVDDRVLLQGAVLICKIRERVKYDAELSIVRNFYFRYVISSENIDDRVHRPDAFAFFNQAFAQCIFRKCFYCVHVCFPSLYISRHIRISAGFLPAAQIIQDGIIIS